MRSGAERIAIDRGTRRSACAASTAALPPRNGLRAHASAQRAASSGVSVNETSSEKAVAKTIVKPNSRMNCADEAAHECDRCKDGNVDERDRKGDAAELVAAGERRVVAAASRAARGA